MDLIACRERSPNLAPYSYFNAFAEKPHYIAIGSAGNKDTLANIGATAEFVINIATYELREPINTSRPACRMTSMSSSSQA